MFLGFNLNTGAIDHLAYTKNGSSETEVYIYAASEKNLGVFTYHTYNETDYEVTSSYYNYYGNAGYDKPNVTDNAHPESRVWHTQLQGLYQSVVDPTQFLTLT